MSVNEKGWLALAMVSALVAPVAQAGVPECGNLRLADARSCELRGDLQCEASCSELGVYKKACATKLQTVCSRDCTLSADATCTDDCTETCTASCDRGENVICIHNCFGECTVSCDDRCSGSEDEEQCYASCEANCDAECDIKCKPLVDGDCYEHCIECCGGSCTAEANLDCQVNCQEQEFETCEHELRADCDASCSGSGAIFCDGEFVLEGGEIPACAAALARKGIADIDVSASANAAIDEGVAEAEGAASLGCSAAGAGRSWAGLLWGLLAVCLLRRRAAGA